MYFIPSRCCLQAVMFLSVWKWTFVTFERCCTATDVKESKIEQDQLFIFNPLLNNKALPKFSIISSDYVVPGITLLIEQYEKGLDTLENKLEPAGKQITWELIINKLEIMEYPLHYGWGIVIHLNKVKNNPTLRDAFDEIEPQVVEEFNRFSQSAILYKAYKELKSGDQHLDKVQLRIINSVLLQAQNGGVELEGKTKQRFNDIQLHLANLSSVFSNNVLDSTNNYSILVTNRANIAGLPESAIRLLASKAAEDTGQSSNPESGPWKITLDSPSYDPVMEYSHSRQLRKRLYKAFITRAKGGKYDNGALIDEIRALRREFAIILGYDNYAAFSLNRNMAGNLENVWEFINSLRMKSYPVAQQELETLEQFAQSEGHKGKLRHWDISYWVRRQRDKIFRVTEEEVRPYFPVEKVLSGLFHLSKELFGITITPAMDADVWHPDVIVFHVYEKEGSYLASFYLDLYSRPREKDKGSWTTAFISNSKLLNKKPVAFLVCNQLPPVGSIPSLMSFTEVKTLFHEFGHALQHMLTTVPYSMAAGYNNIEWDAVEFPSQFMENWVYDNNTISLISSHYKTGETLPQSMFEQIVKARQYQGGSILLNQLFLAALDLELHVSGSYAAGYYGYGWAEVLSQDAFGAFEEAGLQNRDKLVEIGQRLIPATKDDWIHVNLEDSQNFDEENPTPTISLNVAAYCEQELGYLL
ncbi:probable cytosolic oligopeptidase A [Callorhinchus milii]|uniref:probable cytosolic oligopeptidase A n=1 Tax=Callorhinchus milii TaxID=7868 RepID=UPI001C3FD20F|nr:probable cytosolic oligopeptidase A [Callorhinchus milii]